MRQYLCLATVIATVSFSSCAAQPEAPLQTSPPALERSIPPEWTPSLDEVEADVEENLYSKPNLPQMAMNQAGRHLANIADARLFIAYSLLLQELDEKEKAVLFAEQQKWLMERAASADAAVVSKGGSLAPLEHAKAFSDITKNRLKELETRLARERVK